LIKFFDIIFEFVTLFNVRFFSIHD
jgi:hypothetical protein